MNAWENMMVRVSALRNEADVKYKEAYESRMEAISVELAEYNGGVRPTISSAGFHAPFDGYIFNNGVRHSRYKRGEFYPKPFGEEDLWEMAGYARKVKLKKLMLAEGDMIRGWVETAAASAYPDELRTTKKYVGLRTRIIKPFDPLIEYAESGVQDKLSALSRRIPALHAEVGKAQRRFHKAQRDVNDMYNALHSGGYTYE